MKSINKKLNDYSMMQTFYIYELYFYFINNGKLVLIKIINFNYLKLQFKLSSLKSSSKLL